MPLHDRLKPVLVDESRRPTTAWHTLAIGTALAVFAAAFAVAMPLAGMRRAIQSAPRSPPQDRPLATPSVHPPAMTLPSPAAPARPEDDTEVAIAPEPDGDEDVARTDPTGPPNDRRDVPPPKTVMPPQPPDDKHGKRGPDDPGDHDKGYGNDSDRPHKSTPGGKRSGGKKGKKGKRR